MSEVHFGELRTLLHRGTHELRGRLCELIDLGLQSQPEVVLQQWLPYVTGYLESWPDPQRVAPLHWTRELLTHGWHPKHALASSFGFHEVDLSAFIGPEIWAAYPHEAIRFAQEAYLETQRGIFLARGPDTSFGRVSEDARQHLVELDWRRPAYTLVDHDDLEMPHLWRRSPDGEVVVSYWSSPTRASWRVHRGSERVARRDAQPMPPCPFASPEFGALEHGWNDEDVCVPAPDVDILFVDPSTLVLRQPEGTVELVDLATLEPRKLLVDDWAAYSVLPQLRDGRLLLGNARGVRIVDLAHPARRRRVATDLPVRWIGGDDVRDILVVLEESLHGPASLGLRNKIVVYRRDGTGDWPRLREIAIAYPLAASALRETQLRLEGRVCFADCLTMADGTFRAAFWLEAYQRDELLVLDVHSARDIELSRHPMRGRAKTTCMRLVDGGRRLLQGKGDVLRVHELGTSR